MSGHSKWHKLKNKKGKTDAARANVFTKLCRAVTMAAMQGGGDPTMNFTLRLAVEKARAANVPKDNIDRAIKRGIGENDGAVLETLRYEGFGPEGSAFVVEAVTDNRNRTASDMKHVFSKHGGSLAGPGAVEWQFVHRGVIHIPTEQLGTFLPKKDEAELDLIDRGAEDLVWGEDGLEIVTDPTHFQKVLELLESWHIVPKESGLEWVAKESLTVSEDLIEKVFALYEALDEHDDVKAVYTNVHAQ